MIDGPKMIELKHEVARRLEEYCNRTGTSQRVLSDKINMSTTMVNHNIRFPERITPRFLWNICTHIPEFRDIKTAYVSAMIHDMGLDGQAGEELSWAQSEDRREKVYRIVLELRGVVGRLLDYLEQ